MLAPLGALAMDGLTLSPGDRVLDIGCGAGATTRALVERGARAVGVDISAPLLAVARALGGGEYLLADAGADPLPGLFDAAFSRFGVMFFEDPPAAFRHIRTAMRPGARFSFVCWGPLQENGWATEPLAAALPHLSAPPAQAAPGAPGPFAFAQPETAVRYLTEAGWRHAAAKPWRGPMIVGQSREDALAMVTRTGPLARALRDQPEAQASVLQAVLNLFTRQAPQTPIQFAGSVWIVTAEA
jgi:SAM-dependent methyltransferase